MRKKIIIGIGIPLGSFLLFWLICILLFPIAIINGITYNKHELEKADKQRKSAHQNLLLSVNDEINELFSKQTDYLFWDSINNNEPKEMYNPVLGKRIIYDGFLLPLESCLPDSALAVLNKEELRLLRNTIYAKHGMIFQSNDLRYHFQQFNWYSPTSSNVEGQLTYEDRWNIRHIQAFENAVPNPVLNRGNLAGFWTLPARGDAAGNEIAINTEIEGLYKNIINNYYQEAEELDKLYFNTIDKYEAKIKFPLQYRKQYYITDIFPPYISVIEYENTFFDENALNVIKNNVDTLRRNFINITNSQIDIILNDIRKSYDEINRNALYNIDYSYYSNNLSKYLFTIGKLADESINYFYYLISECIVSDIQSLNVNKIQRPIDGFMPIQLDVYSINGNYYHSISLDRINDYIMTLVKDWERYNNDIIRRLIMSGTDRVKDELEYSYFNFESDLSSIINTIGYNYYSDILSGKYHNYYIDQCEISNISLKIIDNSQNIHFNYLSLLPVSLIKIDDYYYDKIAIDELRKSMEIVSSYLIKNTKNVMIEGINCQTEIYLKNIDDYVNWYYSAITRFDKTVTQIAGFLFGFSATDEEYYIDNFYRIMNKNADFNEIIENNMYVQTSIIINLFNYYLEVLDLFMININQTTSEIWTKDDYIGYYRNDITAYFDQVYETLDATNDFYIQDFTVKDNSAVNYAKKAVKSLPGIGFFLGFGVDYAALKTQQLLNSSELKQRIFDSMIENQNNKIAIINDPFNYLFDRLSIGSVLFVDNYFVGFNAYQHYGVYVGNRKVIHFAPLEGQEISSENGIIHETTLEKFLKGRALQIDTNIERKYSENEIIQRARSRLGERGYNLFTNNCEHFARWCVTGERISYQVINSPQKLESASSTFLENLDRVSKFIELFR
jgi:hypothetical protein